jgi:hypothetical protein
VASISTEALFIHSQNISSGSKELKMTKLPIWQMIQECARELTRSGEVPFTRNTLIKYVQKHNPQFDSNSINPIIQGMTDNLKGGAPGSDGKNILHSVGRGLFILYSKRDAFNEISSNSNSQAETKNPSNLFEPSESESDLQSQVTKYRGQITFSRDFGPWPIFID